MNPVPRNTLNNLNSLSFDATALIQSKLSYELLTRISSSGLLRTSPCRSVIWRILLRCLPYEQNEWESVLKRNRNAYDQLKKKNITDPHDERYSQDPQLNNPLAPIEQNPWNSYFADSEIRDLIEKDVIRTFPEIEWFQNEYVHRMMRDILLIYAKENAFVLYKQGMHEILAPLMFVIFSDLQSFQHAKESGEISALSPSDERKLTTLFDKDYLEHDSYTLFYEMMMPILKWYEDAPASPAQTERGPYMRVQDATPTSKVMCELVEIGKLLEETDPKLARHLSLLDIPPQLYGIRWLRLLFGRELPLHDLLYLWDVLLADQPMEPLIHCVFISMLIQIRTLLLETDYGGCLQYLMRYPPIADIDAFMQLARHYRNPKKIARPMVSTNNFSHITVAGKHHPNRDHRVKIRDALSEDSPPSVLAKTSHVMEKVKSSIRDKNIPSPMTTPKKLLRQMKPQTSQQMQEIPWSKEIALMEEQISCLQTRLNEKDHVSSEAFVIIDACAKELASEDELTEEQRKELADKLKNVCAMLVTSSISTGCGTNRPARQPPSKLKTRGLVSELQPINSQKM